MDRIGDLPAHPLLVHAPVVLVPLALLALVAMLVRPAWQRAGGVVVALAAGAMVASVLATRSGEALEEELEDTGMTIGATLRDHAEMGDRVPLLVGVFLVLVIAWYVLARRARRAEAGGSDPASDPASEPAPGAAPGGGAARTGVPRAAVIGVLVASVLAGVVATVSVIRTGHSGASSVWGADEP
ncbi:MAG: DUF2231 domain-containing protein [Ilumatobacteraceae bacterium]|nr:hypothetical protein [Acidimicrobiales bacterium]